MDGGDLSQGEAQVYRLHGLRIRSTVPLAGFANNGAGHDVDVTWTAAKEVTAEAPPGRLVAQAFVAGACRYVAADDGHGWTLRVPGYCDFVVDSSRLAIECRVGPSCDPHFAAVLLAGLGVAFLLGLAGHCVLHASAVEVDGAAVAFAGASGAGKSTLAALACADGGRMVTDDLLRVGLAERPTCVGGSPQLRLRPGATWALEAFSDRPTPAPTVDRRLGVCPAATDASRLPLSVIVLPRLTRNAEGMGLTRVTGAAAVARVAGVGRVEGWKDPDVLRAQFHGLAHLAARVPVVEAVVPWRPAEGPPPSSPPLLPALLDLLATLR